MKRYLEAKSTHDFVWPFTFEGTKVMQERFTDAVESNGWERKLLQYDILQDSDEVFMLRQYMNNPVRKLFEEEPDSPAAAVYRWPMKDEWQYYYVIQMSDETEYRLELSEVELHLYQYGIALLVFRTLNMDKNTSVAEIKKISSFGRCVSLPFLPDKVDGYISCPESISLQVVRRVDQEGKTTEAVYNDKVNYRKMIRKYFEGSKEKQYSRLRDMEHYAEFLLNVLAGKLPGSLSNVNTDDKKKMSTEVLKQFVQPVADGRMFIMSMVRDRALSNNIALWAQEDSEYVKSRNEIGKELYSVLFVDDSSATYQYAAGLDEYMEKSIYPRWMDWGTCYGATEYSLVGITTDDNGVNASVVKPFYCEYLYMVSLVLAQRIGLMKYADYAGGLARQVHKREGKNGFIPHKTVKKLIGIQESYLIFKNKLMPLEWSLQQQGIELYHLLQRQALVEREKEIVDEQISGLYEAVNASNGTKLSKFSFIVSVIALVVSILALTVGEECTEMSQWMGREILKWLASQ